MAFPTRHYHLFQGTLTAGASTALSNLLLQKGYAIAPTAVLANMDSGVYTEAANTSIGCYAASTSTYVYLSNFSASSTHYYGAMTRYYHSDDRTNV